MECSPLVFLAFFSTFSCKFPCSDVERTHKVNLYKLKPIMSNSKSFSKLEFNSDKISNHTNSGTCWLFIKIH